VKKLYLVVFEGDPDGNLRYLAKKEIVEERVMVVPRGSHSDGKYLVKTKWAVWQDDARWFETRSGAEQAAFEMAMTHPAVYIGKVYVYKKSGRKPFQKLLRREAERKNMGRWPNSSGRNRRANV